MVKCTYCRDGNSWEKVCPECGTPRAIPVIEQYKKYIPYRYIATEWDKSVLLDRHYGSVEVEEFVNKLVEVRDYIAANKNLKHSYFIISNKGFSKTIFCYDIIYKLLNMGITVTPVLNTYKIRSNYSIIVQDYLKNKVMIIKVQDFRYDKDTLGLINQILYMRSLMGLATLIISSYDIEEMDPNYDRSLYTNNTDRLKYPEVIRCKR